MRSVLGWLASNWWVLGVVVAVAMIGGYKLFLRLLGVVIIGENEIGIVNKKFVLLGKNKTLPDGKIVALNGEAGFQADTLAPGLHWGLWPWQYNITRQKFITIEEGTIGIVESRDGLALASGRVLARNIDCSSFQDARAFLQAGGERGPQISVIPPGTYRINTALFSIETAAALDIEDNMVGIVTTKEGRPLTTGDIAGPEIPAHNMFQNGQTFIDNGGYKGLQEQVILAGRYYVNPRFVAVEIKPMTEIPIAHVGVVIAYVGSSGKDVTGDAFKHGNLVTHGEKGVWATPLDPGKYPINPYTHKVELVPTANVVLNWATGKNESHRLDKDLSTITVRSADGFKFNLDVSQIIHIPRSDAPRVIARFGNVANLVTQVLEPTIGNYFRNAAQSSDVIGFLKQRRERQEEARKSIQAALMEYNVGAVDTLIGDITPPEALMTTLTDRKLAEQQQVTYQTQQLAEQTRKELEQARAIADTQKRVVDAERSVSIAEFSAQAAVKTADGAAKAKIANADAEAQSTILIATAEANKITLVGNAEAGREKAVGTAQADVIKLKTEAMDADKYASVEIARALAGSGQKLVPEIIAGGGDDGGQGGGLMNVLIASLVSDSLKGKLKINGSVDKAQ